MEDTRNPEPLEREVGSAAVSQQAHQNSRKSQESMATSDPAPTHLLSGLPLFPPSLGGLPDGEKSGSPSLSQL